MLVWDDVMGTLSATKAKFVRRVRRGVTGYAAAVLDRSFPEVGAESCLVEDIEWQQVVAGLK